MVPLFLNGTVCKVPWTLYAHPTTAPFHEASRGAAGLLSLSRQRVRINASTTLGSTSCRLQK